MGPREWPFLLSSFLPLLNEVPEHTGNVLCPAAVECRLHVAAEFLDHPGRNTAGKIISGCFGPGPMRESFGVMFPAALFLPVEIARRVRDGKIDLSGLDTRPGNAPSPRGNRGRLNDLPLSGVCILQGARSLLK